MKRKKYKKSILTVWHLKKFAKRQARLSFADYGEQSSYRMDRNHILRAQRAAKKAAGMYWFKDDEDLIQGDNYFSGRLNIGSHTINYIPGQYAPTEIYWALTDYFTTFRSIKNEKAN